MNKEEAYKNTENVMDLAIKRGVELGINDFVIASCSGKTVGIFLQKMIYYKDHVFNIVWVTHQIGFIKPNHDEVKAEVRQIFKDRGVRILTTTHLLGGVDRALRFQFKGIYPSEIVSTTLRMFGQGIKVCIEISVMAADSGLVRSGEDLIAIGGTGVGADAAAVVNPAHSQNFFSTKLREIICKPFDSF